MFNISDSDIAYAEKILLKEDCSFDEERRSFIKDLTTLDLQAVPGSGKTTALLAKLLILEKYMPFADGYGVLVISHTNAAVDEIHSRIGKYAPKLFRYPNFVGTIQSFVDTFLAVPYYSNHFKSKPYRIDNEMYNEKIETCLSQIWFYKFGMADETIQHISYIKNVNKGLFFNYRFHLNNNAIELVKQLNGDKLVISKPRGNTKPQNYRDYLVSQKKNIYTWFQRFKCHILTQEEVLHFDDAYFLANLFIQENSRITELLQLRFHFVFVDEMQDMDNHQHNLLEKIFYENTASCQSIFQRIGDINQAIYNGKTSHTNEIWSHRENTLQLNGSHRINSKLAPFIELLSLNDSKIEGRNRNDDGSAIEIKPHIIVFNDHNKVDIIPKFAELILELQQKGKIPFQPKNKFKAIAWRKEHRDADKLGLADYWEDFSVSSNKSKIDFKVLTDYLLFYDRKKQTLGAIRKQIINVLLKVLRLENILAPSNKMYTRRTLMNYLKYSHPHMYEDLKLKIYKWSMLCINEKISDACLALKRYIPAFLELWDKKIDISQFFVEGESEISNRQKEVIENSNVYEKDNVKIELGTVHSVKGQTHTATLYLETFFQRKYESQYFKNMFESRVINSSGVRINQAMKMGYVGFSRPTHLLCVAIHKDRFEKIENINKELWEIVELSDQ